MGMDDDGKYVNPIQGDFIGLAEEAEKVYNLNVLGDEGDAIMKELPLDEQFAICVELLSVNYLVGPYELDAMEALTERTRRGLLLALIDNPSGITEGDEAKKKDG